MKQETKNTISFGLFILSIITSYLAGYYAEVSNGWSHLIILISLILITIAVNIADNY